MKRREDRKRQGINFLTLLLPKSLLDAKTHAYISWCITLMVLCQPQMHAQRLSLEAPPIASSGSSASAAVQNLPDAPSSIGMAYPIAEPVETVQESDTVSILSDKQTKMGTLYTVEGNVVLTYRNYVLHADRVTYESVTGRVTADGRLLLMGGADHEEIRASHGEMNMQAETGHFYDVAGTMNIRGTGTHKAQTANSFLFTGREVIKYGPEHYQVLGGSITSCQLPHPDWLLSASKMEVDAGQARSRNTLFRVHGVPLFYLPYATHPVDEQGRQSGLLIPVVGESSTKGLIIGEELYLAINRSTDLTIGLQYYSLRGWAQSADFRYRGLGNNFFNAHYKGLLDRGLRQVGAPPINQGGEDVTLDTRHDFGEHTRLVADIEYLSSYIYRQAFTENFNQAVSSDVKSMLFATHSKDGMAVSLMADRYQSFESTTAGNEIRNFHVPQLQFDALEHRLGASGFLWKANSSVALLRRVEGQLIPGGGNQIDTFRTQGMVSRFDLHPELSYPLHAAGWSVVPHVGLRETAYSQSRLAVPDANGLPQEAGVGLTRLGLEGGVEVKAPVIERDFTTPWVERLLKRDLRHTLEPSVEYRYMGGIDNFQNVLRFDATDIVSNTNEVEYGLTQRLFLRQLKTHACAAGETPAPEATECGGGTSEWLRWRISQKYFFDETFGHAVDTGLRNVLESTLDFSGVAFLTSPRNISPVISRIRLRTTKHTDLEWDLDYDTVAGRIASSNLYLDVHAGNWFGGISHARLDAPGEIGTLPVSNFNQFRYLIGYGRPDKTGFSAAANTGLDLLARQVQYGAIQASYNWNCCGLNVEYRKFELGSVRNENVYRFNFTLAGVGTAGNLRRAEQVF